MTRSSANPPDLRWPAPASALNATACVEELRNRAMPLLAGTRLGSYEILAPLGAGGMGEIYLLYGQLLEALGRLEEGLAMKLKALERDAHSPLVHLQISMSYWHQRRYEEAIDWANKTLALDARHPHARALSRRAFEKVGFRSLSSGEHSARRNARRAGLSVRASKTCVRDGRHSGDSKVVSGPGGTPARRISGDAASSVLRRGRQS